MKNILVLFNGVDYSPHVLRFAVLAAKDGSVLHPVFLKPMHVEESLQYPFPNDLSRTQSLVSKKELEKEDLKAMGTNLQVFIDECKQNNVHYKADKKLETLDELIDLSTFSDLVVADAKTEIGKYSIVELLTDAHCPIILIPKTFQQPDEIILAYDGNLSSIHALKMYSYLFPNWKDKKTHLLTVHAGKEPARLDAGIDEWLSQHFSDITSDVVEGNVHTELILHIKTGSEKKMIVMGAFGRSRLSRLLHRSLAERVIEETDASIFITHQ